MARSGVGDLGGNGRAVAHRADETPAPTGSIHRLPGISPRSEDGFDARPTDLSKAV